MGFNFFISKQFLILMNKVAIRLFGYKQFMGAKQTFLNEYETAAKLNRVAKIR